MKSFTILAALGLVAVAQAQDQCAAVAAKVPTCATSCIQSAAGGAGCGLTDFSCQCMPAKSSAINSAAFGCVLKACGPQTGLAVQTSASAVCACAASAGPASSSAAAPSSAAPAATTGASSAGSSVAGSSSAGSGSASPAGGSSSGPTSTGGSAAPAGTSSAPAAATSATSASSQASFTGGSIKAVVSVAASLALFLGVMIAL